MDMSDFHSVCFCLLGSTLSGSSKITAVIQAATANSTASLKTINTTPISSSTAFGASASRNYKVLAVDCPVLAGGYQYWRMRVDGSSSVGAQDKFLTIQYNPRKANSTAMMSSTSVGPSTVLVTNTTY
ncbi:MAG: hypothetical protein JRI65_04710 [Deltaproteobacteria bacterium]|nr:hypothetical protein [Deltaproteobacteria bacterium]